MNSQITKTSTSTFVNPINVRVSKDRKYLIITLPGNQVIRKPVNYFRTILERLQTETQEEERA
jgi:hypothetical protein